MAIIALEFFSLLSLSCDSSTSELSKNTLEYAGNVNIKLRVQVNQAEHFMGLAKSNLLNCT